MSTVTTPEERPAGSEGGPGPWAGGPPPPAPPYGSSAPTNYPPPLPGYDMPPPIPGVPPLPPGVTLAPIGRRIGAYFLSILLFIVTLVIGYVIWGLILWRRGTSPAFSVLKMRCVKASSGAPATFGTMALREIVGRILEGILGWITELVSLVFFLARADRRCLHDLIGGTVVVYDPEGRLDSTR
ncbi:MAG TPA: RDD family protein [Acidimicrobiales bacterium]|nr:RDD family protein [Acidimicrobiales bacterium]